VINTKYYYVRYGAKNGEHEYQENGVLRAMNYKLALKKAGRAKRQFDRYGAQELSIRDEIREISPVEYAVLKRFILDIDSYFHESLRLTTA
jgi:hypothetical protein